MNPRLAWGMEELERRRKEAIRFPVDPPRGSPEWVAFARMKHDRARRRKRHGYSRTVAEELIAWAEQEERR